MKLSQKEKIKRLESWHRIHRAILFHVWRIENDKKLSANKQKLFLSFLKKKAESYGVDTSLDNLNVMLDANRIIFGKK